MQLYCKFDVVLWNLPCQITKWGRLKDSKGALAENLDFFNFFGPKMALAVARAI